MLAEAYGIPWRAEELERTPAKADQLSRLCGEYPDIRLGLSREPPWDAEAAVLKDGAELGLWSIGACHGYDAVPVALLNLDYLNGYGFGCGQRADELRPTRDPGSIDWGDPEEPSWYCRFGHPPDLPARYYVKEVFCP